VIFCSAAEGIGLDELLEALAGKLCVFAGHSGVGKIVAAECAWIRDSGSPPGRSVRETIRGATPPRRRRCINCPTAQRWIDTPGIREFGLWNVNRDDVRGYYREFEGRRCAFSDCTHTHEPDCGVKAAVATGEISGIRYEGYLRILGTLEAGTVGAFPILSKRSLAVAAR